MNLSSRLLLNSSSGKKGGAHPDFRMKPIAAPGRNYDEQLMTTKPIRKVPARRPTPSPGGDKATGASPADGPPIAALPVDSRDEEGAESFLSSLHVTPAEADNIKEGGFLLLVKSPQAASVYDLRPARGRPFDALNHCTVSLNGVTVVAHGDAAFCPLERFEYEFCCCRTIVRTIPFFQRYPLWKIFTVWKTCIRRAKITGALAALGEGIRFTPSLASALLAVNEQCNDVKTMRLISGLVDSGQSRPDRQHVARPFKLEHFLQLQESTRAQLHTALQAFYEFVLGRVTEACDTTVSSFLDEMKIEADQQMTFMDKAALRSCLRKLTRFMRVVDLMNVAALRAMAISSVEELSGSFSVALAPREPMRRALDAMAACADASTRLLGSMPPSIQSGGEKEEPKSPSAPTPTPPLRCDDSERVVITASSVRFFDDLDSGLSDDPEGNDSPPPEKHDPSRSFIPADFLEPAGDVEVAKMAGTGVTPVEPIFLLRADVVEEHDVEVGDNNTDADADVDADADANAAKAAATATVSVTPNANEVTAVLNGALQEALVLVNVPKRIFADPRLESYRSLKEDDELADMSTPLRVVIGSDPAYVSAAGTVNDDVHAAFEGVEAYLRVFEPFVDHFLRNRRYVSRVVQSFTQPEDGEEVDLELYARTIKQYQGQVTEFKRIPSSADVATTTVDSRHLKLGLMPSPVQCLLALRNLLPVLMKNASEELLGSVACVLPVVVGNPASVEQFVKKKTITAESQASVPELRRRQGRIAAMGALLERNGWPVPSEQKEGQFEIEQNLAFLETGIQVAQSKEEADTSRFAKEIADEVPKLNKRIQAVREGLEKPKLASLESSVPESVAVVEKLAKDFETNKQLADQFISYQEVLGLIPDDYEALEEVGALVSLQKLLWTGMRDFSNLTNAWTGMSLGDVDSDELEKVVQQYSKSAYRCSKGLPGNPVVGKLKDEVGAFSPVLPVVVDLRNDALMDRHWEQIHDAIGFRIHGEDVEPLTLGDLIEKNITHHQEEITSIATTAQQEAVLEGMMAKVVCLWEPCVFDVKPYKDVKDLYVLGDTSEVVANLDDSLVTVNTVLSSRYVSGIRDMVEEWRRRLNVMQETLDEWLNVQRAWMYLEAIFGAPDIIRQLPAAAKMFKTVDLAWKATMKATFEEPNALKCATFKGRKDMFEAHNAALDKVQKSLEEYLETKRATFPRFYFLSDDELLQILAQAKDPRAVQPHLRKCFDNLVRLTFSDQARSIDILAMNSAEGERVGLGKNLKARGNVEDWMTLLEERMKTELTICLKEGLLDYDTKVRSEWVNRHPGQVVATVAQMTWARGTEKVLRSKEPIDGMPGWLQWQIDELGELVNRIRSNLTKLQRKIVVALTTTDVHARDILDEMVQKRVASIDEFLWQQQLRYYWEKHGADDDCIIRHGDSIIGYGYEYMGATSRLVITPMTDRCWLTLTASFGLKLGAAPAGEPLLLLTFISALWNYETVVFQRIKPAGTGKTESSKDLAKAMAILCVVFNCSDQIDYRMMGKLFRGLAQGGYWICLDEFNRIDIEVLSVVAQQMVVLKEGRIAEKHYINFMGVNIRLRDHHVIITMNPGYAGRTELPDNLAVCFRPVSMMVPNYALIAEIMLFAEGFGDAKTLSRKMCKLYILCSEQLSQQPHYDYGLRAVKSVLVMAGGLKRANPNLEEDLVLIRALRDSNQPKFLAEDIPLFSAIILDLFPGVDIPPNDYGEFTVTMEEELIKAKLQLVPGIMTKIIQMYDVFCIRFGATLVGPASGGKTTIYRILANIMSSLRDKGSDNPIYQHVKLQVLNPKCITMGELYGEFNDMTQEWTDGLASTIMRGYADEDVITWRWTVFDGPIDALWIENMNTVLDDNMTLCLANGERIKLKAEMKCLFEVMDLAAASPATVSRIGVVFVTSSLLGWLPFVQTWSAVTLDASIPVQLRSHIVGRFEEYIPKGLAWQRRYCVEPVETVDIQLVVSLSAIFQSLFRAVDEGDAARTGGGGGDTGVLSLKREEGGSEGSYSQSELEALMALADKVFAFSFVWSLGASCSETDWEKFDEFARVELMAPLSVNMPPMGRVYDYYVDLNADAETAGGAKGMFREFSDILPQFSYDPTLSYSQIMVPTVDTRRFSFIITSLIRVTKPIFLTGLTGTGKTVVIQNILKSLEPMPYEDPNGMGVLSVLINFSAQTLSRVTQYSIEQKLEKKRKNLLGAPAGRKCVIFVDDVNMPIVETYGAQPPCELLRQFLDHHGFYDRQKLFWKDIVDTLMFVGAAPPGGGRQKITPRMVRFFNVLCMPSASDGAMSLIFNSILEGFTARFDGDIKALVKGVCDATVELYNRISAELLPTPSKFHYTFNLRDVSKVFQGVLMVTAKTCATPDVFSKLWVHEAMRVFYDRLTTTDDQSWFTHAAIELVNRHLKQPWVHNDLFEQTPGGDNEGGEGESGGGDSTSPDPIMFVGYLRPGADVPLYEMVKDFSKLETLLDDYLDEYNVTFPTQMGLVFFKDAILHISRMTRILQQPRGNAMLVGVGGSGKQSATRIAAFVSRMDCTQIAISRGYGIPEFREDIKKLMILTGLKGIDTVFSFTDSQIVDEAMLEDINNVLNSGEIPNLFPSDELDSIVSGMTSVLKAMGIPETRDNCISQFVLRVRDKLHIVLGMSPVGSALRVRCRNFPSLISCTTLDWFMPWPESALVAVANKLLHDLQLPSEDVRSALVSGCGFVHTSIAKFGEAFFNELRRMVYTTPKSYLDLINLYTAKLAGLQGEVDIKRERMVVGVNKLSETEEIVSSLRADLTKLEPVLVQKTKDAEELLEKVAVEKADADVVKERVSADETVVATQAAEVKAIADDAQKDLDLAMPALNSAVKALDSLTKGDIVEVKGFTKPPPAVQTVMEGVCIMLGKKPDWDTAKKEVLSDAGFLDKLKTYDKNNIEASILKKIQKNLADPNMQIEVVSRVSKAATGLCMWVHAMDVYSKVAKEVGPKKANLAKMNGILADANAKLAIKQAELKAVVDKVDVLQKTADETVAEKSRLAEEQALTASRLKRAEQLTSGLGAEGVRWKATMLTLEKLRKDLIGDTFLSCAAISYYGPFTGTFRDAIMDSWLERCRTTGIPLSDSYSLVATLGDPVEVRDWQNCLLPSDNVSTNNGVLVTRARRWPLMIDPQGQANRWVRKMEATADISITTMKDINLLRSLENCVRVGKPLLIEDVEENIEPSLEPILQRAVFKQGNRLLITIGDSEVDYDESFKLFLTSKMPNRKFNEKSLQLLSHDHYISAHYLPEVCIKVTIINFTVTMAGLEDQLLAMTVVRERPDVEGRKVSLLLQMAADSKQLAELEATILRMLAQSEGNILDDSKLINTLAESKKTSTAIKGRVAEAEKTEIEINNARESYRSVATRGSLIYFVIADLPDIDPMYSYSLEYFQGLFDRCLIQSEKAKDFMKRLGNVIDFTTVFMYSNICRGLFERDKVLFSSLLCFSILRQRGSIDPISWGFFIRGAGPVDRAGQAKNPNPTRISEFQWDLLHACQDQIRVKLDADQSDAEEAEVGDGDGDEGAKVAPFQGVTTSIAKNYHDWLSDWVDCEDPVRQKVPFGLDGRGLHDGSFERLLLIKALREDKILESMRRFVAIRLGQRFALSPAASMGEIYSDLANFTPCIFILSKGADPTSILLRFAKEANYADRMTIVSLGQGQGPYAEDLIKKGCETGDWVFLQNCMLAKSWMPRLENIVFELAENKAQNHKDFRLYLSSSPAPYFPVSVLQNGVKMTNEPPAGVRANVARSFANLVKEDTWSGCTKPDEWKKMLTALCFFHANIQERRKFGPLGWNITYAFDESDLEFSMSILRRMIEAQSIVPWDALNYITGQINYGGRVTDDNDKTCLMAILRRYFTPPILEDTYRFSTSGKYYAPPSGTLVELTKYLDTLPSVDDPEIFGMHENANTTFNTTASLELMRNVLLLQPRAATGGGGSGPDETVVEMANSIINECPALLEMEEAGPTTFIVQPNGLLNSLAIVLTQEIIKFNRLNRKLASTLADIKRAIQGLIVMSPELDELFSAFLNNTLPQIWTKVSFATLKSLGSWVKDLISRVAFIRRWLHDGQPAAFDLPVFFFPQGFMTGSLQTYARKYSVAIDTLTFTFDARSVSSIEPLSLSEGPVDGVYIYGLWLEGARWNKEEQQLAVSNPKEMYSSLPMVHFTPAVGHRCAPDDYACPVYKTTARKGVLSTTGMSTNFVIAVELPTVVHPDTWTLYGVACICSLSD